MRGRWNSLGLQILNALLLINFLINQRSDAINDEGLSLLAFRAQITSDPHGVLADWNPNDIDPCKWSGVRCVDGKVQMIDLSNLSLEGTLSPELGKLGHLKYLILFKNHFSGIIPGAIGRLKELKQLDLRENNLRGEIPEEIGKLHSLKHLLLSDNKFDGSISLELESHDLLRELQLGESLELSWNPGVCCLHRKLGHCIWQRTWKRLKKTDSITTRIYSAMEYLSDLPQTLYEIKKLCGHSFTFGCSFKFRKKHLPGHRIRCCKQLPTSSDEVTVKEEETLVSFGRRKLLEESRNLPALPTGAGLSNSEMVSRPSTRSSGTFPAVRNKTQLEAPSPVPSPVNSPSNRTSQSSDVPESSQSPSAKGLNGHLWIYVIIGAPIGFLLIVASAIFCMCRRHGVTTIGPWKTGLSGQLQKAFITGAPKLNRSELETACEDFSNIIDTFNGCTVYKGTLSSGVEIAVASTAITCLKDWSKSAEMAYRKKIDTLSRVNHKNFVNLLGYCEEDEPFTRMMVFEYAPNGTLFEHLHVNEVGHLDWSARMRIVMGTAYCLQYMHHDLNPPVAHSNLISSAIYLTDDYAAKIVEVSFRDEKGRDTKNSSGYETEHSVVPPLTDPETNVYKFGILLLEIISGKLPYSEEHGALVNWAAEFLNDKKSISYMIDQSLKSFKNYELDVICEVIQDCIKLDPTVRPTMKDITSKLRAVIGLSPDQAVPRLSPLWWAELEILSAEAS